MEWNLLEKNIEKYIFFIIYFVKKIGLNIYFFFKILNKKKISKIFFINIIINIDSFTKYIDHIQYFCLNLLTIKSKFYEEC